MILRILTSGFRNSRFVHWLLGEDHEPKESCSCAGVWDKYPDTKHTPKVCSRPYTVQV